MFPILRPLLHTAALACALPALAADPQPASGGWAQPDPAPIGYAVLNVSRERVESGTACDVGLYVHDELVGNLQPGASLALNLQPGAVDVRLAPNGPGDACRNGMTILAGQTLTLRAGEIRNLRITLGAGGLYHGTGGGWVLRGSDLPWSIGHDSGHEGGVSAPGAQGLPGGP